MIFPLVEFGHAKAHLRVTGTNEDGLIQLKLLAASAIVMDYLKIYNPEEISPFQSPPDDPRWPAWEAEGAPFDVQAATLLVFATLYEIREGSQPSTFREMNPLSEGVRALLHRHRDPAMA